MLRKNLIALMSISALIMNTQPALATILGSTGTNLSQALGASDKYISAAISFSTTTSNTPIWVSVTGSCFIAFGSTPDYVDIDVLIDGVEIGPSTDAPFCSAPPMPNGVSYPMQNGVMAAGNFVGGVSVVGTHQVIVRAKIINANGNGAPTSQASIQGLAVVVSK